MTSHMTSREMEERGSPERTPPGMQLRAIMVVSNPVSRYGLESMLRESPDICHVAAASGPGEAADALRMSRFDLVIASPDMTTDECPVLLETTRLVGARLLLVLRGQDRDDVARAAVANADGYLVEEELSSQVLAETIMRLVRGEMLLPKSFVQNLLVRSHEISRACSPQGITQRERHVLRLLVDGLSNKQIATRLSISEHGAKRHVANLIAKLNCANRTHAVALACQQGLLDVQPDVPGQPDGAA
jgi:two-component system, NarL family, nitrate/nitrite response regulator NarL